MHSLLFSCCSLVCRPGEEPKGLPALPAPPSPPSSPLALPKHPEAQQAETAAQLAQKEEGSRQTSDADAAVAHNQAGPGNAHSGVIAEQSYDDSQQGEGQVGEADNSSMEYAGDLSVSDDEATLEEEEVNSSSLSSIQTLKQAVVYKM